MTSATEVAQQANRAMVGNSSGSLGNNSVSVEAVGQGGPPPDQPAPRSDVAPNANVAAPAANSAAPPPAPPNANELKPVAPAADPNELKPNVASDGDQTAQPPQQVNEIQAGGNSQAATGDGKDADSSSSQTQEDDTASSSKHKKKKGLRKVVPF
jgi:hypothetical protein